MTTVRGPRMPVRGTPDGAQTALAPPTVREVPRPRAYSEGMRAIRYSSRAERAGFPTRSSSAFTTDASEGITNAHDRSDHPAVPRHA